MTMFYRMLNAVLCVLLLAACHPEPEGSGSNSGSGTSDTTNGPKPTTGPDVPTTTDTPDTEASNPTTTEDTNSAEEASETTGTSSGEEDTSDTSGMGGTGDPCQGEFVYCDHFGGCPENPTDEPLPNSEVLEIFMKQFVELGFVNSCYQGELDDFKELGVHFRVIDPFWFEMVKDDDATWCFFQDLSNLLTFLLKHPIQLALSPEQPDGMLATGKEDVVIVSYDLCGTSNENTLKSVTIVNDVGEGPMNSPVIAMDRIEVFCSFGILDNLTTWDNIDFFLSEGKVVVNNLDCFIANGTKGRLEVRITTAGIEGNQISLSITEALDASVLGSTKAPLYTIQ